MEGPKSESPQGEAQSSATENSIVYLTLGDGDFTYSLDLARYMKSSLVSPSTSSTAQEKNAKLILTGVDTLEVLTSKYKDTPFILQDIKNQQEGLESIELKIRHGINAIVHPDKIDATNDPLHEPADHVLFHHPHLGTENCTLHKRFLAHLFYSATKHWMKRNGGIFHLTLVEGQYERWKCLAQAERHGLGLLQKSPFSPPPVQTTNGTGNRYHYRRHQTGKSFGNRRPNSRSFTYTFGRTCDKGKYIATGLPWETSSSGQSAIETEKCEEISSRTKTTQSKYMISCPLCEKEYQEKRSLKCHLSDKHSCDKATSKQILSGEAQLGKKRKRQTATTTIDISKSQLFSCQKCQPHRIFESEKALRAHIRAKHSGMYTYIAPDWSKQQCSRVDASQSESNTKVEDCQICGFKLVDGDLSLHLQDFMPVDEAQTFSCDFCSKFFREERAKLQHMNFCAKRST